MNHRKPLALGTRVSLAVGTALLVVLTAYGLALHHALQDAVRTWERENLVALGHHAAEMVAHERLAADLEAFGLELRWLEPGATAEPAARGAVRVPVGEEGVGLQLASSRPTRETLGRRLLALSATLLLALFLALVAAVQGAVHWGVARPLRAVRKQLRQMRRGPWRTAAGEEGAAEVVSLARDIESVGLTLERRVPEWIEAERKAGIELARRRLRAAALPELQELNALLGDVLARGGSSPEAVRALRRAQAAADRIAEHLAASQEPRAGDRAKVVGVDGVGLGLAPGASATERSPEGV